MTTHFQHLESKLETLRNIASGCGPNAFFAQEAMRSRSIAGSLVQEFRLDKTASADERHITDTLARSLLENYFWLLYIFDQPSKKEGRYEELTNSFKRDYAKLINDPMLPHKSELETPDASWVKLPKALDVNSMLAQVHNDRGDRLNYLYFMYRIASFDTHGKNLGAIGRTLFGKTANFPVLELNVAFDLLANHYLVILQGLRASGEI